MDSFCSECRDKNIVDGFKVITIFQAIGDVHRKTIKEWCKNCLTKYANINGGYNSTYMPKLRDTNIDKYNEFIKSDKFITQELRSKE
tara:strand:+ start:679 stop:939 length:261 start_codon:yes stop_codon:yes gene_type:complete